GPCGGVVTHLWVAQPRGYVGSIDIAGSYPSGGGAPPPGGAHAATPVTNGGQGGSTGGGMSGGGGGGGGGPAPAVVWVVAAAALPVVLYAIDDPARPDVMQCWATPEELISLYGGTSSELQLSAFMGVQGTLRWGLFGIDGGIEGRSLGDGGDAHGEVLLR